MDQDNKLDEVANIYMNIARKLITFNGKRKQALSEIMKDSFFGRCLPGNNFEKIPEELEQFFKILIKWKKRTDKEIEKKQILINKKFIDTEIKRHELNNINYNTVVAQMHMSKELNEILRAILSITMELNRLKDLTKKERDKIRYISI